ncbi:MAG: hypothetical protein WC745_05465 [Patescibacteria group bacterium]
MTFTKKLMFGAAMAAVMVPSVALASSGSGRGGNGEDDDEVRIRIDRDNDGGLLHHGILGNGALAAKILASHGGMMVDGVTLREFLRTHGLLSSLGNDFRFANDMDKEVRVRVKDDELRFEVKKDNDGLFNDFDVKKEFRVKVDNDGRLEVRNELDRDFDFNDNN